MLIILGKNEEKYIYILSSMCESLYEVKTPDFFLVLLDLKTEKF